MEYVQAQFSLKFEPQIRIRRYANQIEDFLQQYYGTPQTMPIPDEFAAEAPRIIINSIIGHSQISFSQFSVDFMVNFDGEYKNQFTLTKEYITARLELLKGLLKEIDIYSFYFAGITYNVHLDTHGKSAVDYLKDLLGVSITPTDKIYEASQRIAYVEEELFFVNEQIGTYKQYEGRGNSIPNLMNYKNSNLVAEGINLSLDVNNRYRYLMNGDSIQIKELTAVIEKIYGIVERNFSKWS